MVVFAGCSRGFRPRHFKNSRTRPKPLVASGRRETPEEAIAAVNELVAHRELEVLWGQLEGGKGDPKSVMHDAIRVAEWAGGAWEKVGNRLSLLREDDFDLALLEHFFKVCPIGERFLDLSRKMEEMIKEETGGSFDEGNTPHFLTSSKKGRVPKSPPKPRPEPRAILKGGFEGLDTALEVASTPK